MKPYTRAERVGSLIQKVLSDLLRKDISDPRLEMITITGVKMSKDLKSARIYFATSGRGGKKEAIEGFKSAIGYVKHALARQLGLRYMPDLKFYYDDSFDYGSRIDSVLKAIETEDGANHNPFKK